MPAFCASATSLSAFVVGHPVAGAGLDQRQVLGAHDPQRPAHREVLDQRAALVELGVQIGDGEAGQPRPQRQIRRGRVGGVQPDDIACNVVDRGLRWPVEKVPACEPGPPLGNRE